MSPSPTRYCGFTRFQLGILIAGITCLLDQLHKWFMLEVINIANRPPIAVTSFFDLVMVWNRGVSFGMFSQAGASQKWFLIIMSLVITCVLLVWLSRTHSRPAMIGLGMIIGGAIGNIIDRFNFGAVADFLSFHVSGYAWPAFNIADSGICVGVALLFLDSMLPDKKTQTNKDSLS